jgi:allophanate hydrolase subunit 2
LGPQDDCFTNDSIERFFSSEYEVTNEADRMGYRLSGPTLEHKAGADIISDGISFGSIQIPGHGMPIVMMADRQTTGGYTKIATVVSTDMPLMAQFKPGDKIRFEKISVYKAHMAARNYEKTIKEIKNYVRDNQLKPLKSKRYSIKVGDTTYDALVEELE